MLDAYIIEELKRRQQERQRDSRRPCLEIPVEEDVPAREDDDEDEESEDRGVIIIDYGS